MNETMTFAGVTLYTGDALKKYDADHTDYKLVASVDGVDWYLSNDTPRRRVWEHCLTEYDSAVPQGWLDQNYQEFQERGGAVWSYDDDEDGCTNILGTPVFWDEVWKRFCDDFAKFAKGK